MLGMNLGDLNGIGKGVDKRWIYKDDLACELAHDYLQKINYSMQDINNLLCENGQIEKRTDVIATIVMTDWIVESVRGYKSCLLSNLLDKFCFSRQEDLQKSHSFIKGIRSFIVAHPLDTNRHERFGTVKNLAHFSDSLISPPSGAATPPAESRPDSASSPTRSRPRT